MQTEPSTADGRIQEKSVCTITHRQIIEGLCPWCDRYISNGQAGDAPNGASEIRWNWTAIEQSLRDDDPDDRMHTVWNLSNHTNYVEKLLPLFAKALMDSDPRIRSMAEDSCRRIGRSLSPEELLRIEHQEVPRDRELAARIMLLGKYFLSTETAARATRAAHIHWIIRFHPNSTTAGSPDAYLDKSREADSYESAKQLWLQQCAASKPDATVLGNAARFFLLNEPEIAERLFREAQKLEPNNPRWQELLAQLYSLSARHGSEEKRNRRARQAFIELEIAEQIRSSHSGAQPQAESRAIEILSRLHTLPARAKAAFAAGELTIARKLAQECLALATSAELPEYFHNDGNAIHYSHLVLGRVALREGDLELAKAHLIESGHTTGSPNLASFGPNMSLAKEMLEKGGREVVLEYLELCGRFWRMGSEMLAEWATEIVQGKVPDFGANLNY
jgi:hypothetical protein